MSESAWSVRVGVISAPGFSWSVLKRMQQQQTKQKSELNATVKTDSEYRQR